MDEEDIYDRDGEPIDLSWRPDSLRYENMPGTVDELRDRTIKIELPNHPLISSSDPRRHDMTCSSPGDTQAVGPRNSPYAGYVPVPVWNGSAWVPLDLSRHAEGPGSFDGHPIIPWPAGFDPGYIPPPRFTLGQSVRFHWGQAGVRSGVIHRIFKHGGGHHAYEDPMVVALTRYIEPPAYEIYWNAHARHVEERLIVKD